MPEGRTLIVGNWKMHGLQTQGLALARSIVSGTAPASQVQLVLCPPFTLLHAIAGVLAGSRVALGAQDCHAEEKGAFTGSISAPMLADAGCRFVIVGHSERRRAGETSEQVAAKVAAAWRAGLTPILCLGETAEEREAGRTLAVLQQQLAASLPRGGSGLALAYEPVWAIGTGKVASSGDIANAHAFLRGQLAQTREDGAAVPILYGGSVTATSAQGILAVPAVGGLLVGGASLEAVSFIAIAAAAGLTAAG
jgi:triosephosphate isomerase